MPESFDVVIVGAGHNGLVCAAYLAKAGRRVLVLEARELVGGCAVTEEIWPDLEVGMNGSHDESANGHRPGPWTTKTYPKTVVRFHEKAGLCQANIFTVCHSLISEFSGIAAGPRPGRAQRAGGKP